MAKFSLSVARDAIYDLLLQLQADHQVAGQNALTGMMWKDEFDILRLADGPSGYSADNFAKSGTDDWSFSALAYGGTDTYYGVSVYDLTDSVADQTWESPTGYTERYDCGSMWTASNEHIVIPADGTYLFTANATFAWNATATEFAVRIRKTSGTAATIATSKMEYDAAPPANDATGVNAVGLSCSTVRECSEDDQFKLQVYHNAGGARDVNNMYFTVSRQLIYPS